MIQRLKKDRCWLYALVLPAYLIAFFLVEHLITDNYWVSWCIVDDWIPFFEWAVIPYVLWYPFQLFGAIYLLYQDTVGYKKYAVAFGAGFAMALLVCVIFPNGQDLRPAVFVHDNLATRLLTGIYAADTNTNVLPSMHVIGSFSICTALLKSESVKQRWMRTGAVCLSIVICISTVLVKQHSILDVIAAVPFCVILYFLVYWDRSPVSKGLQKKAAAE